MTVYRANLDALEVRFHDNLVGWLTNFSGKDTTDSFISLWWSSCCVPINPDEWRHTEAKCEIIHLELETAKWSIDAIEETTLEPMVFRNIIALHTAPYAESYYIKHHSEECDYRDYRIDRATKIFRWRFARIDNEETLEKLFDYEEFEPAPLLPKPESLLGSGTAESSAHEWRRLKKMVEAFDPKLPFGPDRPPTFIPSFTDDFLKAKTK